MPGDGPIEYRRSRVNSTGIIGRQRSVTVLIAGVGYIGAPLALEYLARGESVVGLDNFFSTTPASLAALRRRPGFTFIRGSIASDIALDRVFGNGPFRIIHLLAAQASASPRAAKASYTERTNLVGPRMLLDRASASGSPRVVFASSFHVYGKPLDGCIDESHSFGSFADMSHLSKVYVEKLLEMYANTTSVSSSCVRLGIVYGLSPVMKTDPLFLTVPNLFARQAARNETLQLNPEAGSAMGFIHIDDAVTALLATEELNVPYATANAVTEALTVPEVALAVQRAARDRGLTVSIQPRPRASSQDARFTTTSRLQEVGWQAQHLLAHRIGEVIDHQRSGNWTDS
jgi:nucleoside-diphosphate-sugar epimerase